MANRINCRPFVSRRVWIPRFNLETNIKFIEEYRKHPCLWDPADPLYMKHAPRYRAYEQIAKAMKYPGLDAASVRSKIKIMRSCYISARKQIASKAGTSTPHKPVDWFWTADAFLHDVIRLGITEPDGIHEEYRYLKEHFEVPSINAAAKEAEVYFGTDMPNSSSVSVTEVTQDEEEELIESEEQEVGMRNVRVKTEKAMDDYDDNSIYLELDEEQLMAIENGEMSLEEVTAQAEALAAQQRQERLARREQEAEEDTRIIEDSSPKDSDNENEDEFEAFGRCVALQLKALPLEAALELESEIHALITKTRMMALRQSKVSRR